MLVSVVGVVLSIFFSVVFSSDELLELGRLLEWPSERSCFPQAAPPLDHGIPRPGAKDLELAPGSIGQTLR